MRKRQTLKDTILNSPLIRGSATDSAQMHSGEIFLFSAEDLPPTSLPEFPFATGSAVLPEAGEDG